MVGVGGMRRVSLFLFFDATGVLKGGREKQLLTLFVVGIEERQRLVEAVKLHCRDRNRAPSEPVGMLRVLKNCLGIRTD